MLTVDEIIQKVEAADITKAGLYYAKYQKYTRERVSKMWGLRDYRYAFAHVPETFIDTTKADVTIWDTKLQDYLQQKCTYWCDLYNANDLKIQFWILGGYWLEYVPEHIRPLYTFFCIGDLKMHFHYNQIKTQLNDGFIKLSWNETSLLASLSLYSVKVLEELMHENYKARIKFVYEQV